MTRRVWVAAIAIVVVVVGSGFALRAANVRGQERTTTEWEYLIVTGGNVTLDSGSLGRQKQKEFAREAVTVERNLDRLGDQGWELVTVGESTNPPVFYLKRPKRK